MNSRYSVGAGKYLVVFLLATILSACDFTEPKDAPAVDRSDPNFGKVLNVKAFPGDGIVEVHWSGKSDSEYNLYWSQQAGITKDNNKKISVQGGSYVHTGLVNGSDYYYALTTVTEFGESELSDIVKARPELAVLPAPEQFSVIAGDGRNTLVWAPVAGASGYKIKWSTTAIVDQVIDQVTSSFVHDFLENGKDYSYTVLAVNATKEGEPSPEIIGTPAKRIPAAPTNISSSYSENSLTIKWEDVSNAEHFNLYWDNQANFSTSSQRFEKILPSFIHAPLSANSNYFYRLSAVNAAGESALSGVFSVDTSTGIVTPVNPDGQPPSAVSGINVSLGNQQITLDWNLDPNATGYSLFWQEGAGASMNSPNRIGNIIPPYTHTGLVNGVELSYVIVAFNDAGAGEASAPVLATPQVIVPGVPANVGSVAGDQWVAISWLPVTGAQSYNIYWKQSEESSFPNSVEGVTPPFLIDNNIVNGTTYTFAVTAVNPGGESDYSSETSAAAQIQPPSAPTGVTAQNGDKAVSLAWDNTDPLQQVKSHNIYWSNKPGVKPQTGHKIEISASQGFDHSVIVNNKAYYYVVTNVNDGGESMPSQEVGAIPQNPVQTDIPASVNAVAGNQQVTLNWEPVSGASFYNLYWWQQIPGEAEPLKAVVSNISSGYVKRFLQNGETYHFQVSAITVEADGSYVESKKSNEVLATPRVLPPANAVSGVTALAGNASATITWNVVSDATQYRIYWSTGPNIDPFQSSFIEVQDSGYEHIGLNNGSVYYYAVSALNEGGEGPLSSTAVSLPKHPPPSIPSGLEVVSGVGETTVSWTRDPQVNSYNLYYSTDPGSIFPSGSWIQLAGVEPGFVHRGLDNGVNYHYILTAINAGGESAASAQLIGIPRQNPPAAPQGFSAFSSDSRVTLSWYERPGESHNLYWAATPGVVPGAGSQKIANINSLYQHAGTTDNNGFIPLANGQAYYYVLTAQNPGGESAPSIELIATPNPVAANVPSAVRAESSDGNVILHWQGIEGSTAYRLYWTNDSAEAENLGRGGSQVIDSVTSPFIHTNLNNGTTYYYAVTSVFASGESEPSAPIAAFPQVGAVPPPTGITTRISSQQIRIDWSVEPGVSYNLYWTETEGQSPLQGNLSENVIPPVIQTDLQNGVVRYFVLTSVNAAGESAPSVEFSAAAGEPDNFAPVINIDGQTPEQIAVSMDEDGNPLPFSLQLAVTDNDGDTLNWSISPSPGFGTAMVSGDNTQATVNYDPVANYNGSDNFAVRVADGRGGVDTLVVEVAITAVNDVPELALPIDPVVIEQDQNLDYQLNAKTFTDVDGDSLSYTASSDVGAMPAWLTFDTATRSFSGTPGNNDVGTTTVVVQVDDGNSGVESTSFDITVQNINDQPIVVNPVADQTAVQLIAFSFVVPANTFNDIDGDELTISATSNGGNALPSWLEFNPVTREFSGTPPAPGVVDIEVTATDPWDSSVTDVFILTATNNLPPAFVETSPVAVSMSEDSDPVAFSLNLNAVDNEGDEINWAIGTAASNGTAQASGVDSTQTISYQPLPNFNGSDSFTVTISDLSGSSEMIVNVTVNPENDAPTIAAAIPDQSGNVGTPFNYDVPASTFDDIDGDDLALTAGTLPAWLQFDGSSFSGTPTAVETLSIGVTATDPGDANVSTTFDLVIGANGAPTFNQTSPSIFMMEDDPPVTLSLSATDPENNTITWSISSQGNLGVATVLSPVTGNTASIQYAPNADANGGDTFTVMIDDGIGGVATQNVNVSIEPVNDNPVLIHPVDDQSGTLGTPFNFSIPLTGPSAVFADVDLDVLTVTASPLPPGISYSAGTFSGTPTSEGSVTVVLTASDGIADSIDATDSFIINIGANTAPVFTTTITPQTMLEDAAAINIAMQASDADGNSIEWSIIEQGTLGVATVLPPLTGNTATISYDSNLNANGSDSFTVQIDDGIVGGTNTQVITVDITAVNDNPTTDHVIADTNGTVGTAFNYNIPLSGANAVFSDIDGDPLSFSASPLPAGISFDALTGDFSGTPTTEETVVVVVTADDDVLGSIPAMQTFSITIGANTAPTFDTVVPTQNINEDADAILIPMSASDVEGNPITWSISAGPSLGTAIITDAGGNPVTAPVVGNAYSIRYQPDANLSGNDSVTVQISDGIAGEVSTQTIDIDIAAVNDAPEIVGQNDLSMPTNGELEILLSDLLVNDVDNTYPTGFSLFVQPPLANYNYTNNGNLVTPTTDFVGNMAVRVLVNDGSLDSAIVDINITVNAPITDPLLTQLVPLAGDPVDLEPRGTGLQTYDTTGIARTVGGDTITAAFRPTSANFGQSIVVTDTDTGYYSIVYTPVVYGVDVIDITVNGVTIPDSPLTITVGTPVASYNNVANVPDDQLRACIDLMATTNNWVYAEEFSSFECVGIPGQTPLVSDLIGMEVFTNVLDLTLSNNAIDDISPLASLGKLASINILGNQIVDLSPLQTLTNLNILIAWENLITDAGLAGLFAGQTPLPMSELSLGVNRITDLAPIANIASTLNILGVGDNQITDAGLSIFSGTSFPVLTTLYLNNNQLGPVLALGGAQAANLPMLAALYLWGDANCTANCFKLTDISSLSSMSSLIIVRVDNNNVRDLSPLSALPNLRMLDASNNGIQSIDLEVFNNPNSFLALNMLFLRDNLIDKVGALAGFGKTLQGNPKSLTSLYLENNQIGYDVDDITGGEVGLLGAITSYPAINLTGNNSMSCSGLNFLLYAYTGAPRSVTPFTAIASPATGFNCDAPPP